MKIDVFEKKRSQDLSWDDLGRFGWPKGVVLGGLLGLKLGQKRSRKVMRKKASSWPGLGGGGRDCG